ncbi:CAAX prenyl protease-related protein [Massilia sp. P8910]|uniref:CAAX prenyl protease-related protein n=1 Tax=Massilia antarctica TaxID=2765360 RepID=UPI0006BD7A03|nr:MULTISPECIES: CAAX prenyl protease-related protein [Massilia]MCE3604917.1 CAAX prenyl protease-related protein [Massilia antarctica]MCY0914747.1 CAAX prenyl protease-related protein [Massilia sp. H27-R4]CUI08217.1 CAAX amino terminal protease family protein [Janthinobacterium sp. CG23_2]CUU32003.1 CAAX amino terminal protease family protein [Janthinobacterium sp. CG23_2]
MSERNEQPDLTAPAAANVPMFSRSAWARILPFLVYIFFIIAVDVLTRLGVDAKALRWMYALKIGAVLATLAWFRRDYTELHSWRLGAPAAAVAVIVGVVVLVLWVSLNADWMVIGAPDGFNPTTGGRIDWLMVAVRIAGAALVVPVMEELFWRSFLMRWIDSDHFESLDPAQISLKSFVIGVVLFGFEHNLWLAGIVAGAAYSLLYMKQRSLWSSILAHAVTNGLLGLWIVRTGNWTYW